MMLFVCMPVLCSCCVLIVVDTVFLQTLKNFLLPSHKIQPLARDRNYKYRLNGMFEHIEKISSEDPNHPKFKGNSAPNIANKLFKKTGGDKFDDELIDEFNKQENQGGQKKTEKQST